MKRFALLLLVGLTVLLVACGEGQEVAVEHTAVPTPPLTIQPTGTETAVAAPATVVEETAVPTPTIPTEMPTSLSPLADVLDLHQLTAVPLNASAAFRLKTPEYDFLSDWLSAARNTPERGLPYYYIFDLLAFDFARSFANGAGQLESVFQEAQGGMYLDERLTWPVLQTAVVAYLNQNQISLEDGKPLRIFAVTVNPKAVDFNNDGVVEWLLTVESRELFILGAIPLSVDQSGVYTILPNMILPINTSNTEVIDGIAQMVFDLDLTGDGLVDILRVEQGYLGGPFGYIDVYIWNGSGFYRLERIDMSVPSFKPYAFFEVGDFTNDRVADVKVITPHEVNFNCTWDEVDVYSWNGRTPQHLLMEETQMPDTPECAMFHAITPDNYYSEAVLAEKSRVELLESALAQLTIESAPSADYLALGYLHLAMAYLEQNEASKAQQTINQLYNLPDTASFARLVKGLYAENDGNLLSVCQLLYTLPEQVEATGISDYIYEGSITGFFGIGSAEINPGAICPYPRLVEDQQLETPSNFVPAPSLTPTWRLLLREATGQDDWEWLRDTQTAVLTQTDPTVPEKITQLLNYLPSDDPDAQPYIEHLTYLLGYFYELGGDEENAVSTYLDLIQQYPTSPWSWLAWARLEPVR